MYACGIWTANKKVKNVTQVEEHHYFSWIKYAYFVWPCFMFACSEILVSACPRIQGGICFASPVAQQVVFSPAVLPGGFI